MRLSHVTGGDCAYFVFRNSLMIRRKYLNNMGTMHERGRKVGFPRQADGSDGANG